MSEQDYYNKFIILFLATICGIFTIWFALIREESADWVSAVVVHQASPYAVSEDQDGLIISNVLAGYEFNLPAGFKTLGSKNLNFYQEPDGEKKCEIRHYVLPEDKAGGLTAGQARLVVPLRRQKLIFELADKSETSDCEKYLQAINRSLLIY